MVSAPIVSEIKFGFKWQSLNLGLNFDHLELQFKFLKLNPRPNLSQLTLQNLNPNLNLGQLNFVESQNLNLELHGSQLPFQFNMQNLDLNLS